MIPPIGSVWEEHGTTGWLVVSEPLTDDEDGTRFVLMAVLYTDRRAEQWLGHVESVPVHYLENGWTRVS